jgi:hypothetical protein
MLKNPTDLIVEKAMRDQSFRKSLLANPQTSLESFLSVKLPQGVNVKVVEETLNTIYVVLPAQKTDLGLDEIGLDEVSGFGNSASCTHVGCCQCSPTAPSTRRPVCTGVFC